MGKWMTDLNLEFTGKNHQEVMTYLKDQQRKVNQVDSMLVSAINESALYLQKMNKK
jgi:hypothetical protein